MADSTMNSPSNNSKEDLLKHESDVALMEVKSSQTSIVQDNEDSSNIESEEVLISSQRVSAGEAIRSPPMQSMEKEKSVVINPSKSNGAVIESSTDDVENFDEEPDETILERFYGLAEMFPEPLRQCANVMSKITKDSMQKLYAVSCRTTWVIISSAVILIAPIIFESEQAQVRELQKSHEKQLLLGPSTVMAPPTPRIKAN